LALVNNWTADRTLRWKCPHTKRDGVYPDISALLSFHFYEPVYYLDVEEPTPLSKEKAGYWLGVAHNVGDALTYHILTDDTQTVIQRSVIRSRNDRNGLNKPVTFDPNLDPAVALFEENQNMKHKQPVIFSSDEIPLDRQHSRVRKKHPEKYGRHDVPIATQVVDQAAERHVMEQDNIDDTGPLHDPGETSESTVRRSDRRSRPPSRFVNMVTIGLGIGRLFHSDDEWDILNPLKPLPEKPIHIGTRCYSLMFTFRKRNPEINGINILG
jgi:hypothetical protein